ncbi:hypothetical protein [Neobacillus mesonae]|uniref:hypothetical protein n=1 Tax=Neobacillus mesonae TaxID=1193713 RepID=UPI0025725302|nr:hypothetical protein [Neobacillus mesonae]
MVNSDFSSVHLADRVKVLESVYRDCSDVLFRHFLIGSRVKAVLIASLLLIIIMFLYQWPQLKKEHKKEKAAFLTLTLLSRLLAILLITYPETPWPHSTHRLDLQTHRQAVGKMMHGDG